MAGESAEQAYTLRYRPRQEYSAPLIAHLETLLLTHLHGLLPQSLLGKALHYLHAQWPKLVPFLDDGRYPIDNNACENAIRRSWSQELAVQRQCRGRAGERQSLLVDRVRKGQQHRAISLSAPRLPSVGDGNKRRRLQGPAALELEINGIAGHPAAITSHAAPQGRSRLIAYVAFPSPQRCEGA
jgi:transposase IS66 family protein